MIVFGLTGGVASGKSHVARLLEARGATVLDADRYAKEALAEPEVVASLVERWGAGILTESGKPDRPAIAARVFGDDPATIDERRFLEGLIHPRVRWRLRSGLESAEQSGAPAAVLDVPLLLEAGWDDSCTAVLHVETPAAVRRARARDRGWTAEEFARREASQVSLEEKQRRADALIPGHDDSQARQAIAEAWDRWVGATE